MASKSSKSIDMVNGPLLKNIFIFSVPLMLANLLQMLFNAADTIVVGKYAGQIPLAAVGATGSLIFLITSLFNGLSMASNIIIAKKIGANETEDVKTAVHTSYFVAIAGGILLAALGFALSRKMLELMSTPSDIIDLSILYMRIYFAGSVFMLTYNFGAAILRSKGDTKRPLYFLMISGVLNVVLNLIFVIIFKMSVSGVALATIISQAVSAILVTYCLISSDDITRLNLREISLDRESFIEIIRIGIPSGLQGMVFSLSNVVVQSSINSFDSSIIVAGNTAAANIENFVYIGIMAFNQACLTFTSQNIGAKNYKAIVKIMVTTLVLLIVITCSISFVLWRNGHFFLSLYNDEEAVIMAGMYRMTYIVLPLVLNGILDIFVSSIRSMGYSISPTILMLVGICGIRLTWLYTYFPKNRTLEVIYMCFPISWIATCVIMFGLWLFVYRKTIKSA